MKADLQTKSHQALVTAAWTALLLLLIGGLYFSAVGRWGLWEPWETEYASLGRHLAQNDGVTWLLPQENDGTDVNKPWLTALMLDWGYRMASGESPLLRFPLWALFGLLGLPVFSFLRAKGRSRQRARLIGVVVGASAVGTATTLPFNTEFWLRAPLLMLGLLTVLGTFSALARPIGPHRAGLIALIMGTMPAFMMSSMNLAGAVPLIATTTLALLAFYRALTRRDHFMWFVAAGALTGLSLWAGGLTGVLVVFATVGCFAALNLDEQRFFAKLHFDKVLTVVAVVAMSWLVLSGGFSDVDGNAILDDNLLFVVGSVVLASVLVTASSTSIRNVPVLGLFGGIAALGILVAVPLLAMIGEKGWEDTLTFLLHSDFLSRRTLDPHVSFDIMIRQLGFAVYPYTILFPLALAYLLHSYRRTSGAGKTGEHKPSEIDENSQLKGFFLVYFGVTVGLVGLGSTLTGHYLFIGLLPMAGAVGLLLSDAAYWKQLRENRTVRYLVGFGTIAVLLVLTKDLKTVANPEFGQLGPEVLFEFMLIDGREAFPDDYILAGVSVFRMLWAIAILVYFWLCFGWPKAFVDYTDKLRRSTGPARRETSFPERVKEMILAGLKRVVVFVLVILAWFVRRVVAPAEWIRKYVEHHRYFSVALVSSMVLFAGFTAHAYMPGLSHHLSVRSLIDTYLERAEPGENFYRAGLNRNQAKYYLGADRITLPSGEENEIETIRRIEDLRDHFCDNSQRIFAMVSRDSLPAAYYHVRRGRGHEDDECDPDRDLFVLDARSSRYVLVSNQLDEGEENQNPISESIIEELPADVTLMETAYTFDRQLELLGYRIVDEQGALLTSAGSGDTIVIETYFSVLEHVPNSREMFYHIDYGGQRINGDHDPVNGIFPINYWVPGEIVRDSFPLQVDRGSMEGDYVIYFGFFSGDNRMRIRPDVRENRLNLGTFHITGGI